MAEVSAGIAVQLAMTQQAIALEMLKQNAQMQQSVVALLEENILNVPVSGTRGGSVNISA